MKETEGAKNITFVVDGDFTPNYDIPDRTIEGLLPKIGAEAISAMGCHFGSDLWYREGIIGDDNCYYLLNVDEHKLERYLSNCEATS